MLDVHDTGCVGSRLQDYNEFTLEYGRNNLDDKYPIARFTFNTSAITTNPSASNLVAIGSNATHVTVRLQVRLRKTGSQAAWGQVAGLGIWPLTWHGMRAACRTPGS